MSRRASPRGCDGPRGERAKTDSETMGYHWGSVDADEVLRAIG
ncbi:MAG: hypothetical protein U0670_14265 [Anaerolineae bacterium]